MKTNLFMTLVLMLGLLALAPEATARPTGQLIKGTIVRVRTHAIYVQREDKVIPIHVHGDTPIRLNGEKVPLRRLRPGDEARVRVMRDKDHLRFKLKANRIHASRDI